MSGALRSIALGKFYVVVLSSIPRNTAGTIERPRLREEVAAKAMGASSR